MGPTKRHQNIHIYIFSGVSKGDWVLLVGGMPCCQDVELLGVGLLAMEVFTRLAPDAIDLEGDEVQ